MQEELLELETKTQAQRGLIQYLARSHQTAAVVEVRGVLKQQKQAAPVAAVDKVLLAQRGTRHQLRQVKEITEAMVLLLPPVVVAEVVEPVQSVQMEVAQMAAMAGRVRPQPFQALPLLMRAVAVVVLEERNPVAPELVGLVALAAVETGK